MASINDLAQQIQLGLSQWPTGRLPSVRKLASTFEVSTRTIQLALGILRTKVLIESRPKSGFWRIGEIPCVEIPESRPNAENLLARLQAQIQDGEYSWDVALPLIKELAAQWNCHVQTAGKVLEHAVRMGLLERRGRFHYTVLPKVRRKVNSPTILCLGAGAPDGNFRMDSDRESDFWREMGAQAALAGVSLTRCVWNGGRVQPDANVIGIIATNWHYPDPMAICREIAKLKIPSCVWFDEHHWDSFSKDSRIHYHDQGHSTENGMLLARHLIDLGHKHLADISPWHANPWSVMRLRGIQEEASQRACRVDVCCLWGDSEWDRLLPAQTDAVFARSFPQKLIHKIVEGPSGPVRAYLATQLGWNRIRNDMIPLFAKALESGATAWIGANDACALNAMTWLEEQGVSTPGQISVAGFDDTVEALRSDLTSVRFSCSTVARSMIQQILSGSRKATLTRHRGMVVSRRSTSQINSSKRPPG